MAEEDVAALFDACKAGDQERVRALLEAGVPVDARARRIRHYAAEDRDFTALDYTAQGGHAHIAGLLLERGAAPTALALQLAAEWGHRDVMRLFLDAGVPPDATSAPPNPPQRLDDNTLLYICPEPGHISQTPLMLAAGRGHLEIVKLLLERGADASRRHPAGPEADDSALGFAARAGHADIVRRLLAHGAGEAPEEQERALEAAVRVRGGSPETLRALLEAGADVSGARGARLVIAACYKAYVNIVGVLLDAGTTLNLSELDTALFQVTNGFRILIDDEPKQDEQGTLNLLFTRCALPLLEGSALPAGGRERGLLLTLALRHARTDLAERLLAEWPPVPADVPDAHGVDFARSGGTPLFYAAARGDTSLAARLLEHAARAYPETERWRALRSGDGCGTTALAEAAANGNVAMLSLLLDWGEDINVRPPRRPPAADQGIEDQEVKDLGQTALHAAVQERRLEATVLLLERGADVNTRCAGEHTPLMWAASWGDRELSALLLEHDADVHLRDMCGETTLHGAAGNTSPEVARLLLAHGAEADAPDAEGVTPLMRACHSGRLDTITLLLEHGADANARDRKGKTVLSHALGAQQWEAARQLALHGADPTPISPNDLVAASEAGDQKAVTWLLAQGADVNARSDADLGGRTALMAAAANANTRMVRRLLKAGADVNGTTEHGATALMAAAGMRQTAVVRVLLEYGADVNVQDEDGETALSCASDIGAEEIMEMLRGAVAC